MNTGRSKLARGFGANFDLQCSWVPGSTLRVAPE
jgi:hypothetical protein